MAQIASNVSMSPTRSPSRRQRRRSESELPGVDILINNAGINLARSPAVGDVTAEEWRRVLDVNLSGALHCTQSLLPLLRRRGGGRIVNFSSILAVAGFPGQTGLRRRQGRTPRSHPGLGA